MKKILIYDIAAEKTGAATVLRKYYDLYSKNEQVISYFVTSVMDFSENAHTKIIKLPWTKKSHFHRLYCDNVFVKKLIKELDIDEVINLQNVALRGLKIPQTVYLHNAIPITDIDFDIKQEKSLWLFKHVISKLIVNNLKYADYVIVQAEWIKNELNYRTGVEKSKIIVEHYTPLIQGENTRIESDNVIFFYPASLSSYKNHSCIIKACQLLKDSNISDYEVIFTLSFEDGKAQKKLYDQVLELDLPIRFVGLLNQEEMSLMYRKSILVFPSYLETVGLPLIEAQYFDAQIIAADLPYAKEALGGYTRVEWFDWKRPDQLAELMQDAVIKISEDEKNL